MTKLLEVRRALSVSLLEQANIGVAEALKYSYSEVRHEMTRHATAHPEFEPDSDMILTLTLTQRIKRAPDSEHTPTPEGEPQ